MLTKKKDFDFTVESCDWKDKDIDIVVQYEIDKEDLGLDNVSKLDYD